MASGESPHWTAGAFEAPKPVRGRAELKGRYESFSTRGLNRDERIAQWEHHNARALLRLTARSLEGRPLEATEVNLRLPQLTFARVGANSHIVERTPAHIAAAAADGAALYFTLAGDAFFYHQDGVHLQRPGTMLVCDVNQPFMRGFAQGLHEFVLTVPRAVFEEVSERELPKAPIIMNFSDAPTGDVHAAALARLIRHSLMDADAESLAAIERSALDLMRSLFSTDGANSASARRRAAMAWMKRNLRDPSISVSSVARGIGVSERHLTRAFEETGTGVGRTITELRLSLAHKILSAPGSMTVQDIAQYCGFVSASHFSRIFRERYEQTPSEVRAAADRI
ncbi:helix-turn-helix transcriptional regulator [Microbacterium timonense]|uniref:helix-turn-helix transcriptional regulator n=1 Tax=Microbacterium timonense TaxID=2086576 RepID=UPI00135A755D|nr:AraC family transcriptional regulator [Microbacterium timonense]